MYGENGRWCATSLNTEINDLISNGYFMVHVSDIGHTLASFEKDEDVRGSWTKG